MGNAENIDDTELGRGIRFELSEDENALYVTYQRPNDFDYIDRDWISDQLDRMGLTAFFIFDDVVGELIDKYNFSADAKTLLIAQRRHAEVHLEVTADKMAAYLTLTRSYGGETVSLTQVKALMDAESIAYGVLHNVIKQCLEDGEVAKICVAQGDSVVPSVEAQFECLLPKAKERRPRINEQGSVDYRDLGAMMVVHPGDHLMRRTPANPGKPGRNILGQVLKPDSVDDPMFAVGQEGVASPVDENLLIATITGQPIVIPRGMKIEKTITVKNVDLSSGNLVFDGSVVITGDVKKTMKVKVDGDVLIKGIVEAAEIIAGGDVIINGPVVGSGSVRDVLGNVDASTAIIRAKGSVSANIVEYGYVSAGNNIFIAEMVLHSELNGINEVIIGKTSSAKGQAIGSKVRSGLLVRVAEVGSPVGVSGELVIGLDPVYRKELERVDEDIAANSQRLMDIEKLVASLAKQSGSEIAPVLKKAINTKEHLLLLSNELKEKKMMAKLCLERLNIGKIVIDKKSYTGTQITINRGIKRITEDMKGLSYALKDGKVVAVCD